MRETWTDERLDDLNSKVDELGRRMDARFSELQGEMNSRFQAMETRIDALQRSIILFGIGMFTALAALFASQLALIFTQL